MRFPKPYADFVQRFRVPGGFLLLAAFLWFSDPSYASIAWGMPVCAIGLWVRGWAAGHLTKNQQLTDSGPYAYVRNPLYVGSLLVTAGMMIAARSWGLGVLFAAAFVLIYLPVIQQEESHLRGLFPAYEAYARRVPLLIPRLTPAGGTKSFDWDVYRRNKEWKALGGFAVGVAVLILKAALGH